MKVMIIAGVVLAASTMTGPALGANAPGRMRPKVDGASGIHVGEPKFYDADALLSMLEDVERRLAAIEAIKGSEIATGRIQGASLRESFFGLNVQGRALPQVTTNTAADGTTTSSEVQKGLDPATQGAQAAARMAVAQPTGISGMDILSEQVALEYQLMNLRLLLQGIGSTEFVKGSVDSDHPVSLRRTAAVIGFQVSVDPDSRHSGRAAEIRVTAATIPRGGGGVGSQAKSRQQEGFEESLRLQGLDATVAERTREVIQAPRVEALLPLREARNVASITRKGASFGLGTIAGVFSLGLGGGTNKETYYIVKDIDTVAMDFGLPKDGAARFGWQFRPVLGRSLVEPGMRAVFVHLSLPDPTFWESRLTARVEVRWRVYDSKTGALGPDAETSWHELFEVPLVVPSHDDIVKAELPKARVTAVTEIDATTRLVTATCANCSDVQLVADGRLIDSPATGLVRRTRSDLIFLAPVTALAAGATRVLPRGGPGEDLDVVTCGCVKTVEASNRVQVRGARIIDRNSSQTHVALDGRGLGEVNVSAGSTPLVVRSATDTLLIASGSTADLRGTTHLSVTGRASNTVLATVPITGTTPPVLALVPEKAPKWPATLRVTGRNLDRVKLVFWENQSVPHMAGADGASLEVKVPEDLRLPGKRKLTLLLDDGSTSTSEVTQE